MLLFLTLHPLCIYINPGLGETTQFHLTWLCSFWFFTTFLKYYFSTGNFRWDILTAFLNIFFFFNLEIIFSKEGNTLVVYF